MLFSENFKVFKKIVLVQQKLKVNHKLDLITKFFCAQMLNKLIFSSEATL